MGFKCGIVGLPNVGKSTLFNALTKAQVDAANFPFCTIKPNTGIVPVPDERLDQLAQIVLPKRILPTTIEFVDIAGLVAGASKGEGLGNQFLANIRETDAIAHVVRCFDDENITHVHNKVSPGDDIDVINTELVLADLEMCEKQLVRVTKNAKSGNKEALQHKLCLEKIIATLEEGRPVRSMSLSDEEKDRLRSLQFLTTKPTMYIANVAEDGFEKNPYLDEVMQQAAVENASVVAVCNSLEAEIAGFTAEEKKELLAEIGLRATGLDRVIQAGYRLLNLHTYFTAGPKEVRAWTIRIGQTAPEAAGVIHTDFQKGFIRAEVVGYADFIQYKGTQGARDAGALRSEGKHYEVHDGDVIHFLFNV